MKKLTFSILLSAVATLYMANALAKTEVESVQDTKTQQLEQMKKVKAQREKQLKERKKIRREKAVEKIKLRAKSK